MKKRESMDCGEVYVKMCEKAEEIQELWKPQSGDFTADRKNNVMTVESTDLYTKTLQRKDIKKLAIWWLPRQDQLQEMFVHKENNWIKVLGKFYEFISDFDAGDRCFVGEWQDNRDQELRILIDKVNASSMEQLWLAFLMSEKYKKMWDGEKWIKKG